MEKDMFNRAWITENAIEIISRYPAGELTIRALHYQLVAIGMFNTQQHYKRVVSAMEVARWDGRVDFSTFTDRDREMEGETMYDPTDLESAVELAKEQIQSWAEYYFKHRWENQPFYPEVFIEKKALQGVFEKVCRNNRVALGACKGYPSLTFLHETAIRMVKAYDHGKIPIILYFGDYDPSGEDIPRSVQENINRIIKETFHYDFEVEVRRFALFEEQVKEWKLPPAPAKKTDSRTANWDGLGQVELDAVSPEKLKKMCQDAINSVFDNELYEELMEPEVQEQIEYKSQLKEYLTNL